LSYHRASEAAPGGAAPSMTVCTNDFALCNLVEDGLPVAVPDARGDAEDLVGEVIEFENARICLATIHARVRREEFEQEHDAPFEFVVLPAFRVSDVLGPVCEVMLPAIGGAAWPAVVVSLASCTSSPGELS